MSSDKGVDSSHISWLESVKVYWRPKVRSMLFLGFSAGLPYMLVFATLSRWLRESGLERSTIGFLSWIMLAYAFKWVWSPIVDRLPIPILTRRMGRRRSWMLLAQLLIIISLAGMAISDPQHDLARLALFALLTAFSSATQDIAIDAYRIEAVKEELQAAMAATYMIGYRIAMIVASAGALYIAAFFDVSEGIYRYFSWMMSYYAMAGMMLVGVATTFLVSEPEIKADLGTLDREGHIKDVIGHYKYIPGIIRRLLDWIYNAVISPFLDFLLRYRWYAVLILLLIGTYRISDIVLGVISNVFYFDIGFSKKEVANISNIYGTIMTLTGAGLGGVLMVRYGVMKILFVGALLSAATNVLFSIMSVFGKSIILLAIVISADNLSAGIATAAFVAYLSSLTNISYTATQYALFSSVMLLLPKFIGGFSGVMVDRIGYGNFFILTALMGIPVLILILLANRYIPSSGFRKHDE
jgi:PAT family beta-lactamase induction signal transducer AmpG